MHGYIMKFKRCLSYYYYRLNLNSYGGKMRLEYKELRPELQTNRDDDHATGDETTHQAAGLVELGIKRCISCQSGLICLRV